MDEIVRKAMEKWPNVPHCYGWLALDARGNWRLRDETAQARDMPGDTLRHEALVAFINRNYSHDETGRWFFQNGPQRVYVDLAIAPFVARTDPQRGLVLHTGEVLEQIDSAWMTEDGQLLFKSGDRLALLDDRDLAECLDRFQLDGDGLGDGALITWLAGGNADTGALHFMHFKQAVRVRHVVLAELAEQFGFVKQPRV
ncbi:MAG: DUF2946 family protein [Janthinobacterium lividum]